MTGFKPSRRTTMKKTKQKKVLIFNGPPGSGKDFAANLFKDGDDVIIQKFAEYLKEAAMRLFMTDAIGWRFYENFKEKNLPEFLDKTPREIYIQLSEGFYKPLFGKVFFGKVLGRQIVGYFKHSLYKVAIVSDGGFKEEILGLLDYIDPDEILIIQLKRKNCSFKDDSRKYVRYPGVKTLVIENDGSPQGFEEEIGKALCRHEDLTLLKETLKKSQAVRNQLTVRSAD